MSNFRKSNFRKLGAVIRKLGAVTAGIVLATIGVLAVAPDADAANGLKANGLKVTLTNGL